MMMSSPIHGHRKNSVTYSMTSLLDIVPTILDWFNITYMNKDSNQVSSPLTGKSLLPLFLEGISVSSIYDAIRCLLLERSVK